VALTAGNGSKRTIAGSRECFCIVHQGIQILFVPAVKVLSVDVDMFLICALCVAVETTGSYPPRLKEISVFTEI
jgi:hypothetical protein